MNIQIHKAFFVLIRHRRTRTSKMYQRNTLRPDFHLHPISQSTIETKMNQLTQPPVLYFIAALAILVYTTALAIANIEGQIIGSVNLNDIEYVEVLPPRF